MVLPFIAAKAATKAATWGAKKAVGKFGGKAGKYGHKVSNGIGSKVKAGDKIGSFREKMGEKVGDLDLRGRLGGLNMREKLSSLGMHLPERDPDAETTPYLGKWDRISQVWINKWTVLLLLVLVRVLISADGVSDNIANAKEKVLSACVQLETVGSAMASMPHYMSTGINEMAAEGIEGTVNGAVALLTGLISGVENIIIFFISLWKSTWTCLISALVQGAFDLAAKVVEGAVVIAKKTTEGVAELVEGAETAVKGFIDAINFIPVLPDIPDVDWTGAIDKLRNLDINADEAIGSIMDVKDKVPTYEELEAETNKIISIPFELAKSKINEAWGDFKFDRNVLPVAEMNDIALCSTDNRIPVFFDRLADGVEMMRKIFIGGVVALAILAILFFAWWEIKRFRRSEQTIEMAEEKAHDLFDASWIAQHPHIARFAFWLSERISDNPDTQLLVRWVVAYSTTPTAMFVLALALSGFFNCLLQTILLVVVKKEIPKLAADIGGLAAGVVSSLEATSGQWANNTNSVITKFQGDLNDDMFGNIKQATGAVNKALTTFTDGINKGLDAAFGNTPFLSPLKTVVDCVLLDKIEKVQEAITFVEKNAHLTFPKLNNDTFSIKRLAGSGDGRAFLDDPEQATNAEIGGAVDKVVAMLMQQIITEVLISSVLLLLYIIVVLMGVGRAFYGKATGINASQPGGLNMGGNRGGGSASNRGSVATTETATDQGFDPQTLQYMVGPDGNQYAVAPDGNLYAVAGDGMPYGPPVDAEGVVARADEGGGDYGEEDGREKYGPGYATGLEQGRSGYDDDTRPVAAYDEYRSEYYPGQMIPGQMMEGPNGEKIGLGMGSPRTLQDEQQQQQQQQYYHQYETEVQQGQQEQEPPTYGLPEKPDRNRNQNQTQHQDPFDDRFSVGRPGGGGDEPYPSHPPAAYKPSRGEDEMF